MNATLTNVRFPIRLDPVPGESFDGWLDAYAQRLLMSTRELSWALGLPPQLLRQRGMTLAKGSPALDAEQIAARACGLEPAQVEALWLGLARYDRLITPRIARCGARQGAVHRFARMLRPMTWSRYCSQCLRQTGRWLAAWRLPWYLACPTHHTMLASNCPACGGTQRVWAMRATYLAKLLTVCGRDRAGGRDARCGQALTSGARVTPTPAPADLIAFIDETCPVLDPAVDDERANKLIDRLIDTILIASRVAVGERALRHDRPNFWPVLATALIEAHRALREPDDARMRAIATNAGRVTAALPAVWDGVSPPLAAVVIRHRDPYLGVTERLRYRSMTGAGRPPEGIDPGARMRALPLALWPDWSIRLRPPTIKPDRFRIAAAILLCLPGTTVPLRTIRDPWASPAKKKRMKQFFTQLAADPHSSAILAALCTLADTLDRDGSPVDYTRRRELADQIELIDPHTWTTICRATGALVGTGAKLAHVRLWLWETLTGGLPEQAPLALQPNYPAFLDLHSRFKRLLSAPTARRLTDHARHLLDAHEASHEPLSWSPPLDQVAAARLPGPEPDATHAADVRGAIANQPTTRHTASELGITLEHLHYIARKHPLDTGEPTAPDAPARVRFAALLGVDQLRRLLDQGTTLRQIETGYGIGRRTLRDELVLHGIPLPPKNRRRSSDRRQPTDCPPIPDHSPLASLANVHQ